MRMRLWPTVACLSLGLFAGLGGATFRYAEGLSYLSTDPASCANCHIMLPQYDSWQKASHHAVATCADCHLPDEFPAKYVAKAANGWSHSKGFTLQNFAEPIMIKPGNAAILHANCLRCHADLVHEPASTFAEGAPRCARCHAAVGHGDSIGIGGPFDPEIEAIWEDR